ncbi:MAG: type I phosphomannose isomerase catalytic subunit [Culicoidibacterales bacterium]
MTMLKLEPFYSPKVWGYEHWQFSTHPNGMTVVAENQQPLQAYFEQPLPILIKYIVANETLSVQVHPDDSYARAHTSDRGKTECWYITEATPGAQLICGLVPGCDESKLATAIHDGTLEEHLLYLDVQAGDMIYIPAGTVHAIMGGLKLIEIQQSSDTTYRLYDWGRDRETHISESLAVIDFEQKNGAKKIEAQAFTKLETPYFTVVKEQVQTQMTQVLKKPTTLTFLSEGMHITKGATSYHPAKNETMYLDTNTEIQIHGSGEVLQTTW